nr:PIN domain-containing protein [Burkholderia sp. A2]
MATRLVVDTCVWLDLARDYREQPIIGVLEDLVDRGEVEIIVQQQVLDEFDRNEARVIDEARPGAPIPFPIDQASRQPLW